MKHLIIISLLLPALAFSQECKVNETVIIKENKEDINTAVPKELEDGEIIVRTKDGKERLLKSNEFKVVKRKQQFKTKERVIVQKVECEPVIIKELAEENLNLIAVGVRKDYIDLDSETNGNSVTISKKSALVLDLSYMRRQVFGSAFALGLGLDTNKTPRAFLGIEF